MRCFCPPDRLKPLLPTIVASPFGNTSRSVSKSQAWITDEYSSGLNSEKLMMLRWIDAFCEKS
jgi:hypothetical protein